MTNNNTAKPMAKSKITTIKPKNFDDDAKVIADCLREDIPVIIGTTYHEFTRDREDPIFKPLALQQAADRTAAGCAPVYLYQFTWESPVLDGAFGSR